MRMVLFCLYLCSFSSTNFKLKNDIDDEEDSELRLGSMDNDGGQV